MSAYDQLFSNPSIDPDRPAGGPIFVNASPTDLLVLASLELARDLERPEARAVIAGLDSTETAQQHVVTLAGPATVLRTTIAVRVAAMKEGAPREITLQLPTPGTRCSVRILAAVPN